MLVASATVHPWSPFEVLLDQMLVEVLQLQLQELHEWDDGLQREERGTGEGREGCIQQGTAGQGGSQSSSFPQNMGRLCLMWSCC